MAGLYPQETIDRIRESVDIVDVIASYLPLKKSGANYTALCPFHTEKTPSFSVSQSKQIFHCFGCGVGGNAITFIIKYENLPFTDALQLLANRAGIALPKQREGEDLSRLYAVNEEAKAFFGRQLEKAASSSGVKRYLEKRGLKPETVEKFSIGFAPDSWDMCLKHLASKGFSKAVMGKAGLVKKSSTGNLIDCFRNRLIFPIFNERGRVAAFGGRVLDGDPKMAKYLNSPDTPVYSKGRMLYGLNWASDSIRKNRQALLVEGYMDVIPLHQAGIDNVVATSGTAFSHHQCRVLMRFTKDFVMIFDGDEAGHKAASRATEIAMEHSVRPKIVMLPTGEDPDSLIREKGTQAFLEAVKEAKPYVSYLIDVACGKYDLSAAEGRADAARSLLPELARISDPIERASYVRALSDRVGIPVEKIEGRLPFTTGIKKGAGSTAFSGKKAVSPLERWVISIVLEHPELMEDKLRELKPDDFKDAHLKRVFEHISGAISSGTKTAQQIIDSADDESLRTDMRGLLLEKGYERESSGRIVEDFLSRVRQKGKKRILDEMKLAAEKEERGEFLNHEKNFRNLN